MIGRLLTIEEIRNLKEGDTVYLKWQPFKNRPNDVYQITKDKLFFNEKDKGSYNVYINGNTVLDREVEVYEWIEKQYKLSEIIAMIENGKLKNDDILIDNEGDRQTVSQFKDDDSSIEWFMRYAPYKIKKIPVSFEEAYQAWKQGTMISYIYDDKRTYVKRADNFGLKLSLKEITEDCQWFIEKE